LLFAEQMAQRLWAFSINPESISVKYARSCWKMQIYAAHPKISIS
jgi:hypothetical protein